MGRVYGVLDKKVGGIMLYEMLTGKVPYGGDSPFSVALKHKTEKPKDPRKRIISKRFQVKLVSKKLLLPALIILGLSFFAIILWQKASRKGPALIPSERPSLAVMYFKNNTIFLRRPETIFLSDPSKQSCPGKKLLDEKAGGHDIQKRENKMDG